MLLSVIITTKNEARNIGQCIEAMRWAMDNGTIEIIVVDNFSTDDTAAIAKNAGVKVVLAGPERSGQRNRGIMVEAVGQYVLYVDADMRVGRKVMDEILDTLRSPAPPDALYVREEMVGSGLWTRIRNFERGFYEATCIDGVRVIRRALFMELGGFDETLCGTEDWDMDRRIKEKTPNITITRNALQHDESELTIRRYLRKKSYYASNFDVYCRKWNNDETIRKQFGLRYRLWTVFMENGKWRRSLRRPDLMIMVWFYKVIVGFIFLVGTRTHRAG
jgi:glycosyltransferase involved in cell wall biosynthesis